MSTAQPLNISVWRVIDAPAEVVYDLLSDITRMGEYSSENTGGTWLDGATHPVVGARFKGTNRLGFLRWSTKPTVTAANRGRLFAFKVPGASGPLWSYLFEDLGSTTKVTESMRQERPSPLVLRLMQRRAGVTDRAGDLERKMAFTLEHLARVAERHLIPR
jgi:Polyketide cyclase / dehydrase and lipid transport